jgi:hypothetical protein
MPYIAWIDVLLAKERVIASNVRYIVISLIDANRFVASCVTRVLGCCGIIRFRRSGISFGKSGFNNGRSVFMSSGGNCDFIDTRERDKNKI